MIGAIARALLCNETETHHLFNLAGLAAPTSARRAVCEKPSAATQAILDALDPLPAMVQNARFDIRGYNRAYCRLRASTWRRSPRKTATASTWR